MVENAALTAMPSDELLEQCIDRYLDEHWEDIVADIDRLVRIPSFEDLGAAAEARRTVPARARRSTPRSPWRNDMGFGGSRRRRPRRLRRSCRSLRRAAGHHRPHRRGAGRPRLDLRALRGYAQGRLFAGPRRHRRQGPERGGAARYEPVAPHAARRPGAAASYTLRFIFGVNEETRMDDVHYYRAHHADPAFLFTPRCRVPRVLRREGHLSQPYDQR